MDGEGLSVKPFGSPGRIDPRREGPPVVAVVLSKVLQTASLFWAYGVLHLLPLAVFMFVIKAASSAIYVLLQRPLSSGKKISRAMWMRVLRYSVLVAVTSLLWTLGLTLCGALRTVLLWEHSETVLLAVLGAMATLGANGKGRGTLFFLLGVASLLLFDNDRSTPPVEHPEGPHRSMVAHFLYWLLSFLGVPDHKGGVVLLLCGLCLSVVQRSVGKKLAVDLGGAKRLQALSTLVVAVFLMPWAAVQLATQETNLPWLPTLLCLLATSLAMVADYYTHSIAAPRAAPHYVARASSLAAFSSAVLLASLSWYLLPPAEHGLSAGVVIGALLLMVATSMLTHPAQRSHSTLIGYSTSGLPLYSSQRTPPSIFETIRPTFGKILENPDSRRIFYFLLLNLVQASLASRLSPRDLEQGWVRALFTIVELSYGMWTNSLGLISDGFHMLFDCTALLVGLYAALMSRWKPTRLYSYGYGRVEVLSGFVNGLFLVVIACFVFAEALERLLDPPNISTERLLFVSVAGFIVNLIGIITFSHNHSHSHSHGHSHSHAHSHNANMQGVFLHVLADTMGSVGVIISSILVEQFGWLIADPICSLFIATLIFISVIPLLRDSASILLLATPSHRTLHTALNKLPMLDGILSYSDAHFWQQGSEAIAGTLHVQVAPSANEQKIITMVTNFLKEQGVVNLTVQVEKDQYLHCNITQSFVDQLYQSTPPQVYVDYGPHAGQIKAV